MKDIGSGIGNLVHTSMKTTGMVTIRNRMAADMRIRSTPSIRFMLSQM